MREIKFRAWDKKHKWMDSGPFYVENDGKVWEPSRKTYDTPNREIDSTDDLVLMQFTGLYDKNGKEIWESDLLIHDGHGEVTIVVFAEGMFLAKRKHGDDELAFIISEGVLVLGNIYDWKTL